MSKHRHPLGSSDVAHASVRSSTTNLPRSVRIPRHRWLLRPVGTVRGSGASTPVRTGKSREANVVGDRYPRRQHPQANAAAASCGFASVRECWGSHCRSAEATRPRRRAAPFRKPLASGLSPSPSLYGSALVGSTPYLQTYLVIGKLVAAPAILS